MAALANSEVKKETTATVDNIDGNDAYSGASADPQAILARKLHKKKPAATPDEEASGGGGSSSHFSPKDLSRRVASSTALGGKKMVLLVEDVRVSQRVASVALSRAKFKVDTTGTAEDAVKKWMQRHYDIVLMDINLGSNKMDGVEATEKIRAEEKEKGLSRTTIFGLTGNLSEEDIKRYKEADMDGVIAKGNILLTAVQEAIEKHAADPTKFVIAQLDAK